MNILIMIFRYNIFLYTVSRSTDICTCLSGAWSSVFGGLLILVNLSFAGCLYLRGSHALHDTHGSPLAA
jgi:hypothetical protein